MLMPDGIKVVLLPEPLLPRALHLPLELDYILTQNEPSLKKAHVHAHALDGDRAHLLCELSDAVHALCVSALKIMALPPRHREHGDSS